MKKRLFVALYWILSLTWGIIMSFIGFIVALVILILKGEPYKNGCSIIIEIGEGWGGLSLGCFTFYGETSTRMQYEHLRKHEFGHSLQNCIMGPFFIFLVAIPSAIRYQYYTHKIKKGYNFPYGWYDSVWFEKTATKWGIKAMRYF